VAVSANTLVSAKAHVKDLIPEEGGDRWADTWIDLVKAKHPNVPCRGSKVRSLDRVAVLVQGFILDRRIIIRRDCRTNHKRAVPRIRTKHDSKGETVRA